MSLADELMFACAWCHMLTLACVHTPGDRVTVVSNAVDTPVMLRTTPASAGSSVKHAAHTQPEATADLCVLQSPQIMKYAERAFIGQAEASRNTLQGTSMFGVCCEIFNMGSLTKGSVALRIALVPLYLGYRYKKSMPI